MNPFIRSSVSILPLLPLVAALGCGANDPAKSSSAKDESEALTNRIAIPEVVRRNLGISFVKVERRRVASTLRVSGTFEHVSTSHADFRAPVAGRVEILVEQYDDVDPGALLYRIHSPEWTDLRTEMAEAERAGAQAGRRTEAGRDRVAAIEEEIALAEASVARLEKLAEAGGGRAAELSAARSDLARARSERARAEEERAIAEMENIRLQARGEGSGPNARFAQALSRASAWTGLSPERLLERVDAEGGGAPRWRTIEFLEGRAAGHLYVETIEATSGGWVEAGDPILEGVDHTKLIFRALALQSDIGALRDGLSATIVPPQGGSLGLQDTMPATLRLGLDTDPDARLADLLLFPEKLASWARPGVAAHAEVVLDQTAGEETAIPLSCVVSDGLDKIYFLRDRNNPDQAVRVVADLGVDDGRWVAVRSGLKPGDEVVFEGSYELKLTGAGKANQGGHFHSDGTFHDGEE